MNKWKPQQKSYTSSVNLGEILFNERKNNEKIPASAKKTISVQRNKDDKRTNAYDMCFPLQRNFLNVYD
jgi:hypothetical protein